MLKLSLLALGATATVAAMSPVGAQAVDPKWSIKLGVSRLALRDKVDLFAGGALVPGAAINTKAQYTASIQIGYFLTDHIAFNFTGGIPPKVTINGKGTIAPFGRLASTQYGPTAFTLQYHPLRHGVFRPYVGAGGSYMIDFSSKDGAFTNVKVHNDLAPAVEGGAEIMLSPRFGVFADVKKAWLRPKAFGSFMGTSVVAKTYLDPLVLSAGGVVHF